MQNYTSDDSRYQSYVNNVLTNEKLSYVKGVYEGKEGYYFELYSYKTPNNLQEDIKNGINTAWIYEKIK